jgi:hypothetical protein
MVPTVFNSNASQKALLRLRHRLYFYLLYIAVLVPKWKLLSELQQFVAWSPDLLLLSCSSLILVSFPVLYKTFLRTLFLNRRHVIVAYGLFTRCEVGERSQVS